MKKFFATVAMALTLMSANAAIISVAKGYVFGNAVEVEYWMPFVYGQGLHDADWQDAFGGELYKTKGSHGCINLPKEQAKIIYDTIEAGYPIIYN